MTRDLDIATNVWKIFSVSYSSGFLEFPHLEVVLILPNGRSVHLPATEGESRLNILPANLFDVLTYVEVHHGEMRSFFGHWREEDGSIDAGTTALNIFISLTFIIVLLTLV